MKRCLTLTACGKPALTSMALSVDLGAYCLTEVLVQTQACAQASRRSFICQTIIALFGLLLVSSPSAAVDWLKVGQDGRLEYGFDGQRNRIPDFSFAGFREGAALIEDVPNVIELKPSGTADDTDVIQRALDEVGSRPGRADGIKGAVLLSRGTYRIAGTIRLRSSGVVLRGTGPETVLEALGDARSLIEVGLASEPVQQIGARHQVDEDYVPLGATRFALKDVSGLKPGDEVIVERPFTQKWISSIAMDKLVERANGRTRQWQPSSGLHFERKIASISGNAIELTQPLFDSLRRDDEASVWRYKKDRASNIGIEKFSVVGWKMKSDPNNRRFGVNWNANFVAFLSVQDAWILDVQTRYFVNVVYVSSDARQITMRGFRALGLATDKKGAKPAVFNVDGQGVLIENCEIEGSNTFVWATLSRVAGPTVFKDCHARGKYLSAGAHQRWAVGTLFDNVSMDDGSLFIGNRGSMGSGHGWSGANSVVWNSQFTYYRVHNPPGAYNWAYQLGGESLNMPAMKLEHIEIAPSLAPRSLYEQQLLERTGARR